MEDRELRMQLSVASFAQQVEAARGGAMDQVSEVDFSAKPKGSAGDRLRACQGGSASNGASGGMRLARASGATRMSPNLGVRFSGDSGGFEDKFLTVLKDIGRWRRGGRER